MNALDKFKQQMREHLGITPVNIKQEGDKVIYSRQCSVTKDVYIVKITVEQFDMYNVVGMPAHDVFEDKSLDDIEFIISGTTPAEFKLLKDEADNANE